MLEAAGATAADAAAKAAVGHQRLVAMKSEAKAGRANYSLLTFLMPKYNYVMTFPKVFSTVLLTSDFF